MQIYNNQSPSFGCVRLRDGGLDYVKKEGLSSIRFLDEVKEGFKNFNWHLDIDSEGYKLTNPINKQTYKAPFKVIKHYSKGKLAILMKNINNHTVSYSIPCTNEEISLLYKAIKNSKGLEKMTKILKVLEHKKDIV